MGGWYLRRPPFLVQGAFRMVHTAHACAITDIAGSPILIRAEPTLEVKTNRELTVPKPKLYLMLTCFYYGWLRRVSIGSFGTFRYWQKRGSCLGMPRIYQMIAAHQSSELSKK